MKILDEADMEEQIHYKTFKGDAFSNTVRNILFHVVNHTTHHRGQIVMEFRTKGVP